MAKTPRLNHLVVANSLLRSRIFAGLPSAGIAEIGAFSTVRNLEKGEYLFHEGEPCEGFFVVQRGVISVQRVSAAGKVQVIHVFHPGDSFAEAALVSGEGYPGQRAGADAERGDCHSENGICGAIAQTARACIENARIDEPASAAGRRASG